MGTSSLKKSKSFTTALPKCSTPKSLLSKEVEFLNILYDEGILDDNSQFNAETKINTQLQETLQESPIITNLSQGILRCKNKKPVQSEATPSAADLYIKKNVRFTEEIGNLNRNLDYEEEEADDKDMTIVNEDDELIKHVNKMEHSLHHEDNLVPVGFRTGTGQKIMIKKDLLESVKNKFDEEINKINSNEPIGFSTAKGNKITVKKETLDLVKNTIFKDLDKEVQIDEVKNGSPSVVTVGFTTAKGNQISVKKESIEAAKNKIDINEISTEQSSEFKTVSGKTINLKPISIEIAKKKLIAEEGRWIFLKN